LRLRVEELERDLEERVEMHSSTSEGDSDTPSRSV